MQSLCDEVRGGNALVVALENGPSHVVVSGTRTAVERCVHAASRHGATRVKQLATSHAFHSPLMADVVDEWSSIVAALRLAPPSVDLAMNATGTIETSPERIRRAIVDQMCAPVRWSASIRALICSGVDEFVEVGDSRMLAGLQRAIDPTIPCTGVGARWAA